MINRNAIYKCLSLPHDYDKGNVVNYAHGHLSDLSYCVLNTQDEADDVLGKRKDPRWEFSDAFLTSVTLNKTSTYSGILLLIKLMGLTFIMIFKRKQSAPVPHCLQMPLLVVITENSKENTCISGS